MNELLSLPGLFTLLMLVFLQAVLGFDNLLYVSIESRRAPPESQESVRRNGVLIAIIMRLALLGMMLALLENLTDPLFSVDFGVVSGEFTFGTLVFLAGGGFIMYTAMKEISHMLSVDQLDHDVQGGTSKSPLQATLMIVLMNLIFSFDSILSAVAITKNFLILGIAVVVGGVLMLVLAGRVAAFLQRNRMYEVLGLFVLLLVGVLLLSEGGHQAHLEFFGFHVEAMSKTTFYFSVVVMVILDIVQGRYQKKLARARKSAELST